MSVATLGQNIQFVAFVAHCAVAALIVEHSGDYRLTAALLVTVFAAIKEFYYDAREERNPPQTFRDNFEDFAGYWLGAVLGLLL